MLTEGYLVLTKVGIEIKRPVHCSVFVRKLRLSDCQSLLKKAKHGQFVMLNQILNLIQDLVQHLVKSIGDETLDPSIMTAGRQVQGDTNILFQQTVWLDTGTWVNCFLRANFVMLLS